MNPLIWHDGGSDIWIAHPYRVIRLEIPGKPAFNLYCAGHRIGRFATKREAQDHAEARHNGTVEF